jgi:ferredoxin
LTSSDTSLLFLLFNAPQGLPLSHDCKMGVCMMCPAKLASGQVDQGAGMLSDDVIAKGYTLLCTATPTSDCVIEIVPEEELLKQQLVTAQD